MGWIDNLINDIPSASHYRLELESMEQENAALKQEIGLLRAELDALRTKTASPDRLDGETEKLLMFISRQEYATVSHIEEALSFSRQVADMYIEELTKAGYIEPSYASGEGAEFYLKPKAKRYLHRYGLL